jgi:hypothetical protein
MTGGLLQLVAYGAQDVYLTGNPQVTFFKLVYRRHTNFSQETIEQTFNGQADFGKKVIATLSRNGDLVHKIWLWVNLPKVTVNAGEKFRWLNWLGHLLIKTVELECGGQLIDKMYSEWLHIFAELTMKAGHQAGYANMVGNVPKLTNLYAPAVGATAIVPATSLYIPLPFYFCRNPGLCIPLVAMQYHELRIVIELRSLDECCHFEPASGGAGINSKGIQLDNASLLVDYIFLDTDERRRFAQVAHEYLITQLQFTGDESTSQTSNKIKLSFNHPTKEIIWVTIKEDYVKPYNQGGPTTGRQWFNFTTKPDATWLTGVPGDPLGGGMGFNFNQHQLTNDMAIAPGSHFVSASNYLTDFSFLDVGENPTAQAKLMLNGHDRFAVRDGRWFNLAIPYTTHENIPSTGINVYNFALRPEEHQPSGTLNFSRIDQATLSLDLAPDAIKNEANQNTSVRIKIFAVSYNIMRIMSGMGGLAYSS